MHIVLQQLTSVRVSLGPIAVTLGARRLKFKP